MEKKVRARDCELITRCACSLRRRVSVLHAVGEAMSSFGGFLLHAAENCARSVSGSV